MLVPSICPINLSADDVSASFKLGLNDVHLGLLISSQKFGSNELHCVIVILFKKDDPTIRIRVFKFSFLVLSWRFLADKEVVSASGSHCDLHVVRFPFVVIHTIWSMNKRGMNFTDSDVSVEFDVFLPTQKEITILYICLVVILFPKLRCPFLRVEGPFSLIHWVSPRISEFNNQLLANEERSQKRVGVSWN